MRTFEVTLIAVLFFAFGGAGICASADDLPAEYQAIFEKCDRGSALDGYFCLREAQFDLDQNLKELVNQASAQIQKAQIDGWLDEPAVAERRAQFAAGHGAWRTYRDEHCHAAFGYYRATPIHPPSQSQSIMNCVARKTVERIVEIKQFYLPTP